MIKESQRAKYWPKLHQPLNCHCRKSPNLCHWKWEQGASEVNTSIPFAWHSLKNLSPCWGIRHRCLQSLTLPPGAAPADGQWLSNTWGVCGITLPGTQLPPDQTRSQEEKENPAQARHRWVSPAAWLSSQLSMVTAADLAAYWWSSGDSEMLLACQSPNFTQLGRKQRMSIFGWMLPS